MKASLLLVLALLAPLSAQELLKLPTLTTKAGKKYEQVSVTEKRVDGVSIRHAGGTARIPFEQLPDDVSKSLGGFDEVAAKEARSREAALKMVANQEAQKAQAAKENQAKSLPGVLKIIQSVDGGVICKISWINKRIVYDTKRDKSGARTKIPREETYLSGFGDKYFFVSGVAKVADGDIVAASLLESSEMYSYTMTTGAKATIRKYKATSKATPYSGPTGEPSLYTPPVSSMRRIGGG